MSDSLVEDIFEIAGLLIAAGLCLLAMWVFFNSMYSILTEEEQAKADLLIDNMPTERPVSYHNITVLDKMQ